MRGFLVGSLPPVFRIGMLHGGFLIGSLPPDFRIGMLKGAS